MADVMRELERLRPVYETGVLRLLLRQNAMLYVSLLRSTFDPLTGELPRETVEERFAQSLSSLADAGEYAPREDQTFAEAAHQILADLTREGEGDYAWLANSHDAASHRFLYRLTARAHRTRPERPRRRSPAVDSGGRSAGHGQQRRPSTPAHGQPHPAQPGDR